MQLLIQLRARFGQTDIVPANDAARALARIAGNKTLRLEDIRTAVTHLGCTVMVETGDAGTAKVSAQLADMVRDAR